MTLNKTPCKSAKEPGFSVTRQILKWRDWVANPATKLPSCSLSCMNNVLGMSLTYSSSERPERIHATIDGSKCTAYNQILVQGREALWMKGRRDGRSQKIQRYQKNMTGESTDQDLK